MLVSKGLLEKLAGWFFPLDRLEAALLKAGFELENVQSFLPEFRGVVTATIEKISKHPNADRLSLCRARSNGRTFEVICGATNIHEGAIVPLALEGATLQGRTIAAAKIRGIASEGMFCSQKEVGVSQEHEGIWLLPKGTPVGVPLENAIGLPDVVYDVSIPPNRGDCLSHFGLLRELLTLLGEPLPRLSVQETFSFVGETPVEITLAEDCGCTGYVGTLLEFPGEVPTPLWLSRLLLRLGKRSVNFWVDLANYVLLEVGQPLHTFDADILRGGEIRVRSDTEEKEFQALDSKTYRIPQGAVWIFDKKGPVALAGIIGGAETMVTSSTRRILLEAARFDPIRIRKTARKLRLSTDASFRFERGVENELAPLATNRFLGIAQEESPGVRLYRPVLAGEFQSPRTTVHVVLPRVEKLLGFSLSKKDTIDMLERLGRVTEGSESSEGGWDLEVASYRQDIRRPCDVGEEIARFVGYESFNQTMPKPVYSVVPMEPSLAESPVAGEIKAFLRAYGFNEVVTYPFSSKNALEALENFDPFGVGSPVILENPLQATDPYLRNTLALSFMKVIRTHTGTGKDVVRCFEMARIFGCKEKSRPSERETIGVLLKGGLTRSVWERSIPLSPLQALKGIAENILSLLGTSRGIVRPESGLLWEEGRGFCIEESTSGSPVAVFGEVSQKSLRAFDVKTKGVYFLEVLFPSAQKPRTSAYRPFGRFPAALRDASFVAPEELAYQELENAIERFRPDLLADYELFDVYRGEAIPAGFKVYNVRCTYQSMERTLTDEEANDVHFGFIEKLTKKLPMKLRT